MIKLIPYASHINEKYLGAKKGDNSCVDLGKIINLNLAGLFKRTVNDY